MCEIFGVVLFNEEESLKFWGVVSVDAVMVDGGRDNEFLVVITIIRRLAERPTTAKETEGRNFFFL